MHNDPQVLAAEAAQAIAEQTGVAKHDIALVLGSGWGQAAELVEPIFRPVEFAESGGFRSENSRPIH